MQPLYSFLIFCLGIFFRIAAAFNKKAAQWVKGRRDYWTGLENKLSPPQFNTSDRKLAWFHCSSLGEFEQGRPIMEAFKKQFPEYLLLLTFFSPSGYEVRQSFAGADVVVYLPLDTKKNVRKFVDLVRPDIAFFVKYEFWFNFLSYLQEKKIPTVMASAVFRPEQHFFKAYAEWPRSILKGFARIFLQNND